MEPPPPSLTTLVYNENFSLNLQSLHLQIPSDLPSHLWIIYRELYRQAIQSRSHILGGNSTRDKFQSYHRRIIIYQISTILKDLDSLAFSEKLGEGSILPNLLYDPNSKGWFSYPSVFLESLIVFLMDIDNEKITHGTITPFPTIIETGKISTVLPMNLAESCFCDSVLVAMFLSTDFYDILLNENNNFIFPWKDEGLLDSLYRDREKSITGRKWIKLMKNTVATSACYKPQKGDATRTVDKVKKIQGKLLDIVKTIREHQLQDTEKSKELAEKVSQLRKQLKDDCERGTVVKQEDPIEFFLTILAIGSWGPIFLPIMLEMSNTPVFLGTSITDRVSVNIALPEEQITSFRFMNEDRHPLQTLIDWNLDYIQNGDRTVTSSAFLRVPEIFAFKVGRIKQVGKGPPKKDKTEITIPEDDKFKIPVMRLPANINLSVAEIGSLIFNQKSNLWDYEIIAIACQTGGVTETGHFVLYFKYNGTGDWFYYNDAGPVLQKVDIHENGKHKTIIEQNAYLFWAKRL